MVLDNGDIRSEPDLLDCMLQEQSPGMEDWRVRKRAGAVLFVGA